MKLKSNILKLRRNGRTVYSARTDAVHNELQRINKEVINKYGLKIPNRNAIIKTIIQFLSQGEIYSNRKELPLTPLNFKVIKMDIKNYFPSINKHILYSKIVRSSILNDSSIETIKSFIFSNAYMGIPLGLAFSNSLSELYLEEFDSAIQLNWQPLLYVRYVDDILLIVNERIDENEVVEFVKKELKNYHLEVNDTKTDFQVSSNQFSFTYLGYKFSKFQKKTLNSKGKIKHENYLFINISEKNLMKKF